MSKLLIASDIHGSAYFCAALMERITAEVPERILLLGDLLYHGPRNDLPKDYDPKAVISMLNALQNKLLCVRGNCDSEVDQMVLSFPILADYALIALEDVTIFATHGHHFTPDAPPPHAPGDIFLCGHTHVPKCAEYPDYTYLNPGSVSIPKEGSPHSYMTFEDGVFLWKTVESGSVWQEFSR